MMAKMGLPEDQPIQHSMISRALENAQTKIEGFNFDSRKHLLEFDSVINIHRTSIYNRRRAILLGDAKVLADETAEIITRGGDAIAKVIDQKKTELGADEWNNLLRRMLLQSIDTFWVEHLETMDYLRTSVNLRAYGQRDPLIEYKREALALFKNMKEGIYEQLIRMIPNVGQGAFKKEEDKLKETIKNAKIVSGGSAQTKVVSKNPGVSEAAIGRNDKVTLVKGDATLEMKYKKAESYLKDGWKIKS